MEWKNDLRIIPKHMYIYDNDDPHTEKYVNERNFLSINTKRCTPGLSPGPSFVLIDDNEAHKLDTWGVTLNGDGQINVWGNLLAHSPDVTDIFISTGKHFGQHSIAVIFDSVIACSLCKKALTVIFTQKKKTPSDKTWLNFEKVLKTIESHH